jgi:DNA-directed RNA polymerase subunit K/omega
MEDASDFVTESLVSDGGDAADTAYEPLIPAEPAPPITSRFLYVDVAARRAKQLRRGARLRYDIDPGIPAPKKPERQAMEEVRRRLVQYTVPPWKGVDIEDTGQ